MIDTQTVFEIHHLKEQGMSVRKIAKALHIARKTVRKYLDNPMQKRPLVPRKSKLDPFRNEIKQLLEQDPRVSAEVVKQRIELMGYAGGITIIRDLLHKIRPTNRQAFIRFESAPGKQMQIDWGHFGSLDYGDTRRKLYALAVVEAYSRMLYVEFTHSQNQSALHQCMLNAFTFFGGTPQEIVVDNMLTAVIERQGRLIRFNDAFLTFLIPLKVVPIACNPGAPHEKGKIENAIKYLRRNFWPLRTFADLCDVNRQVRRWLDTVANVRVHRTTLKRPQNRFENVHLSQLPELLADCRETETLKVYKDFAVRFDANTYTTPPWAIGKWVTLKADQQTIIIFYQHKRIATHDRCWQRGQRIETPTHKEQVRKLQRRLWLDKDIAAFSSLGNEAVTYLQALSQARQPIKKNVSKLLSLKDDYGSTSIIYALKKALVHNAIGADYIENILYQEMTPKKQHPPVRLKKEALNNIRLPEPSLAEYDVHVIKRSKE
jgi:transposase